MATVIRPEISKKNKYYVDKHRYYELKHFCLQYKSWRKMYEDTLESCISISKLNRAMGSNVPSDITSAYAMKRVKYAEKIKLIERVAMEADTDLYFYILKAVTEGLSYTYLKSVLDIPCGRDMFYDRYRKFFWLLSEARN